MTTINDRIKILVDHFSDGNNSKFASEIGVSEANIRNYISKTEPKFSALEKIVKKFEINYEWLLTGQGVMLKPNMQDLYYNESNTKSNTFLEETKSTKNVILSKEPKIWIIGNPFNPVNKNINLEPINFKVSIKVS